MIVESNQLYGPDFISVLSHHCNSLISYSYLAFGLASSCPDSFVPYISSSLACLLIISKVLSFTRCFPSKYQNRTPLHQPQPKPISFHESHLKLFSQHWYI